MDASQHATIDWKNESCLFVVTSTYGDGDMPDNAQNFWDWLQTDAAGALAHFQFSVLALGDTNYAEFCAAGKKIDARLEQLGATRIFPRTDCDVDYEDATKKWIDGRVNSRVQTSSSLSSLPAPKPSSIGGSGVQSEAAETVSHYRNGSSNGVISFSKTNPFPSRLLKNLCLNKAGSGKEVRHFELDLDGSSLIYEPGDALGVLPLNCPALVEEILSELGCTGDESVKISGTDLSLWEALNRYLDITKPTNELLEAVAQRAGDCELVPLLAPGRTADLKNWLWGRGVIDMLELLQNHFRPPILSSCCASWLRDFTASLPV